MNTETIEWQRKCSDFVGREVIHCVSTLIYNLREVAEKLDDYDTYMELCSGVPDYEEAAWACIQDTDEDTLKEMADYVDLVVDGDADAIRPQLHEDIEDYEAFCREFDIETDDYQREVFEHWLVTEYLGRKLTKKGEVVREYMGLTIWGRTTTGQSISIDGVIEEIVRDQDAFMDSISRTEREQEQ